MSDEVQEKIEKLEAVSSSGYVRHFTFEPPEDRNDFFDPYHPELGLANRSWQVVLGDLGVMFCHHYKNQVDRLFIPQPDFTELYREFDTLEDNLLKNGVVLTYPVLCWIRGLIHALMSENPRLVPCTVVMTGMSTAKR